MAPDPRPLRERKKERTRLAIQQVALDLFDRQGYARTTIEQIAAAADVSPSTVYRYFETKEALVFWDRWDPRVVELIASRPAGEAPIDSLRAVVHRLLPEAIATEGDAIRRRTLLSLGVPELRAHLVEQWDVAAGLFARALAERTGRGADDLEIDVIVRAAFAALLVAMQAWVDGRGELVELAERAIEVLAAGGRLLPATR